MEADVKQVNESGMVRSRLLGAASAVVELVAIGLVVAACGGGSAGPGVAGAGSPTTSAGNSPSGSAHGSPLAYSRCMRAHGLPAFPDPNSSGQLALSAGPGTGLDPGSAQFKAATQACRSLAPGANQTPAEQRQHAATALKFAQCMRSHGVPDFPDPNSQGGIELRVKPGSDLAPDNPQFISANKVCQHLLPGRPGGGAGLTNSSGPR